MTKETIEEYLSRGGKITKCPTGPYTSRYIYAPHCGETGRKKGPNLVKDDEKQDTYRS